MHQSRSAVRRRWWRLLPLTVVLVTAACDSTTAPDAPTTLDTREALKDYQTLQSIFASDGWASFTALGGRSPLSTRAGVAAISTLGTLGDVRDGSGRRFAVSLMRELGAPRAPRSIAAVSSADPIVSDTIRGHTFTYNAATDQYAVDPTRTGAPADGVRFILYAVDATDRPIPDQEIGYADLTDESPLGVGDVALRLVAVKNGATILNYRTGVTFQDGAGQINVDGYVVDGTDRLDFTISANGTDDGGQTEIDLDFDLRLQPRGFRVVGDVQGVSESDDGAGTVALTVTHRENILRVDMDSDGQTLDGLISLNGRAYVTVTGDAQSPTLRGASGGPLTGEELLVVLAVVDTVDDVFDLVEDLVQPVDNLLALGWIL